MFKISIKLISIIIHATRQFLHYHILLRLGFIEPVHQSVGWFVALVKNRGKCLISHTNPSHHSCHSSFHSFSHSSSVRSIELEIGLIELGIGLIELGIGQRINNARLTVLARVTGLVNGPLGRSRYVRLLAPLTRSTALFCYITDCWARAENHEKRHCDVMDQRID